MREKKRGFGKEKIFSLIISLGIILTLGYGIYSVATGIKDSQDNNNIVNLNDSEGDNVAIRTEDMTDSVDEQGDSDDLERANAGASRKKSDSSGVGEDSQYETDVELAQENHDNAAGDGLKNDTEDATGEVAANGDASAVAMDSNAQILNAAAAYTFGESNTLSWPVAGDEILKYSMDTTIYFPTLGVYKCNPAILIGAAVGSNIGVAADGVVESVDVNEETGNTISIAIGDGYVTTYGFVDEAVVKKGDTVVKGQLLGKVAQPTAYYAKEGSGVYFKVTKDDEPVDPNMFLED